MAARPTCRRRPKRRARHRGGAARRLALWGDAGAERGGRRAGQDVHCAPSASHRHRHWVTWSGTCCTKREGSTVRFARSRSKNIAGIRCAHRPEAASP